jgi:hypothetical protein
MKNLLLVLLIGLINQFVISQNKITLDYGNLTFTIPENYENVTNN